MKKHRLLICMLIVALLTSCGNGGTPSNSATDATPTVTATVNETDNSKGSDSADVDSGSDKGSDISSDNTGDTGTSGQNSADNATGDTGAAGNDDNQTEKTGVIEAAPVPGSVSITKKNAAEGNLQGNSEVVPFENKSGDSGYQVIGIEFKNKDTKADLKEGEVKTITFANDSAQLDCPGATVANVDGRVVVTIEEKGSYVIKGSCENGQIVIDSDEAENVHLYLNGLDLNCNGSAAIYEKKCDKLIITLASGSVNNIGVNGEIVFEDVEKEEPDSAVFAKDKLVINGDGELYVFTESAEGIHSKDDVILISGDICVKSGSHGIKGKDSVVVNAANISINAKGDGIKSTNKKDEGKGYIVVLGGNINISSENDGIQAEGEIQLTGGVLSIFAGGGRTVSASSESSSKGVKATRDIYINGAAMQINSSEVSLKSDADVIIDDGNLTLASGKKGIAGLQVAVYGGKLNVDSSKEGIEGKHISVNGGTSVIYSKNDGIGAVDSENPEASDVSIAISNGVLYINAGTDGLDSKGDLTVSGGTVMIDGPAADGNSAIDVKGKAVVEGGTFVALASDENVNGFDPSSKQNSVLINFGKNIKAGTSFVLKSSSGNIVSFVSAKASECVIISSPELKAGETYSLMAGSEEIASVKIN